MNVTVMLAIENDKQQLTI